MLEIKKNNDELSIQGPCNDENECMYYFFARPSGSYSVQCESNMMSKPQLLDLIDQMDVYDTVNYQAYDTVSTLQGMTFMFTVISFLMVSAKV